MLTFAVEMMRARLAVLLGALLVCLAGLASPRLAWAYEPPPLHGHVVDTSGGLSAADVAAIDARLDGVMQRHGFAIVVFVVGSLDGQSIDDVAYDTFNAWGVGRDKKDDGVLLVIAPKERRVRIEVGKGLEGALTDLESNDIIRQAVGPRLAAGDLRGGIDAGTARIEQTLLRNGAGEPGTSPTSTRGPPGAAPHLSGLQQLGILAIFVVIVILLIVSPTFRSIFFWILWGMIFRGGGGGGGGGGWSTGSGYSGGGGRSGGGGSSDSY